MSRHLTVPTLDSPSPHSIQSIQLDPDSDPENDFSSSGDTISDLSYTTTQNPKPMVELPEKMEPGKKVESGKKKETPLNPISDIPKSPSFPSLCCGFQKKTNKVPYPSKKNLQTWPTTTQPALNIALPEHKVALSRRPQIFPLYSRRWVMLFLLIFMYFCNFWSFAPFLVVSEQMCQFYGVSVSMVKIANLGFLVIQIPGLVLAVTMIHLFGLRFALILCAIFQIVGSWIRFMGASPDRFWALVIGSAITCLGQPILEASQTVLVVNWFDYKERTTAISLFRAFGWSASLSLCSSLLPLWVTSDEAFSLLLLATAAIVTIIGILNIWILQDCPPHPPSAAANTERLPFCPSCKRIFVTLPSIILVLSYGATLGVLNFYCFFTRSLFLNTETNPMYFAAITVAGGIFSVILSGIIVDRYKNYKFMLLLTLFGSTSSMVFLSLVVSIVEPPYNTNLIIAFGLIYGIFVVASYSVAVELGAEIAFPVAEQFSVAMIVLSADLWTIGLVIFLLWEIEVFSPITGLFTMTVVMVLALLLSFFIRPEYNRSYFEHKLTENGYRKK